MIFGWSRDFSREISLITNAGIPSSSEESKTIFFIAKHYLDYLSLPFQTIPKEPSPIFSNFSYLSLNF